MNYRDDYDDEENVAPVSLAGIGRLDVLVALGLAVLAFLLLSIWGYPGLYPECWTDTAVAAGTRPPESIFPGLWRILSMGVFRAFGVAKGVLLYRFLGHLFGSLSASLVYLFFRECLSISVRHRQQAARRRLFTVRVAAAVSTCALICSEPFWRMSQTFTSVTLLFFLSTVAMTMFSIFLRNGSMGAVYLCSFLGGVVAGETPFGMLAVFMAWGAYWFITRFGEQFAAPLLNPATAQVSKWHITFLFVFGCLCTVGLNCYSFVLADGLKAMGSPGGSVLPLKYCTDYGALFTESASAVGVLFLAVMIILPWFVSAAMLPKATDEEHFLPYGIGIVYVIACLFAVSQLGPVGALWIWGWRIGGTDLVTSPFLMLFMALLAAASIMGAIVVLGIDGFCRDHRFIAQQQFGDMSGDDDDDDDGAYSAPRRQRLSRKAEVRLGRFSRGVVMLMMLMIVPAVTIPSRYCGKTRAMLELIGSYLDAVLEECDGRRFLFTDGRFDAALEVVARMKGTVLLPMSMMSDRGDYDTYLRLRGITDGEDRLAAAIGAPSLLRTWVRDKPAALAEACAQLGFELWKRDGHPLPTMLGVVARPGETSADALAAGVARSKALAERIFDFYARYRNVSSNDHNIELLFETVQWRVARQARFRGEALDLAGDVEAARQEVARGDDLDACNASLRDLLDALERVRQNARHRQSPREGLQQALENANFALASQYADAVLKSQPENVDANFAMGMLYMNQGQFARAEDHLSRCLVLAPKEPAVYNNLAMIQIQLRKFDAAEKNARRALELAPQSAEVLDTIKQVNEARSAAATNAPPAAAAKP